MFTIHIRTRIDFWDSYFSIWEKAVHATGDVWQVPEGTYRAQPRVQECGQSVVSVMIFFRSTRFVFPSCHRHFVHCTLLKPTVTFDTYLLFNCPSLTYERSIFFSRLSFYGYSSPDTKCILNQRLPPVVPLVVDIVHSAGVHYLNIECNFFFFFYVNKCIIL